MWVFFNRDKIGVLNGQCGHWNNSISILCSRHKCVCKVFQFQFRFDAVFVDATPFAVLPLPSLTEPETVVDDDADADAGAGADADDVVSISHFGHRISLLSDEWHCSWIKIAACVAKRIPQLLTLHLVVMTLFRLLIPSETIEQYQKYVSTFLMRILSKSR